MLALGPGRRDVGEHEALYFGFAQRQQILAVCEPGDGQRAESCIHYAHQDWHIRTDQGVVAKLCSPSSEACAEVDQSLVTQWASNRLKY